MGVGFKPHPRLENPENPADGLCELCGTTWPCAYERLRAENAELKVLLRKVLLAHPHIEPKPGCLICQALDEHESLRWGE